MNKAKSLLYQSKNARLPSAVLFDKNLSNGAVRLYAMLLGRARDFDEEVTDCKKYFAKIMGQDERTIATYFKELVKRGYLEESNQVRNIKTHKVVALEHFFDMSYRNGDNPHIVFKKYF